VKTEEQPTLTTREKQQNEVPKGTVAWKGKAMAGSARGEDKTGKRQKKKKPKAQGMRSSLETTPL